MNSSSLRRLSPVRAFQAIRQEQPLVTVGCDGFSPARVEAGGDRDVDVTASFVNNTDEFHDIRWGATVDGEVVGGFNRVSVPPPTVQLIFRSTQTITIPSDMLPSGGGSVEIGVQQRFGRQQSDVCGDLTVEPAPGAEPEPTPEPEPGKEVTISGSVPSRVQTGEPFTAEITLSCPLLPLGDCFPSPVTISGGGQEAFRADSIQVGGGGTTTRSGTFTFDSPGTQTIQFRAGDRAVRETVEIVTAVEEELEFDPANVVIGQCGQDFPVEDAPGETRDVRVIVTNTNDVTAIADIVVRADGREIGRVSSASIPSLSNQTVMVTITIPPAGTYSAKADLVSVIQGTGRAPAWGDVGGRAPAAEPVRAGASNKLSPD